MNNYFSKNDIHITDSINEGVLTYICKHIEFDELTYDNGFELLGEGEEAWVYGFKQYAIKIKKEETKQPILFNDIGVYKKLKNTNPLFSKMYAYKHNHFLVMERFDGNTLADLGMLSISQVQLLPSHLKWQLLSGIRHAFEQGLRPSDLHKQNIMISHDNQTIRIVDVGCFTHFKNEFKDIVYNRFAREEPLYLSLNIDSDRKLA